MVYVGNFNENDLKNGRDKEAVAKAKAETGLDYVVTKIATKRGEPVGIMIWVCTAEEFTI